MSAAVASREKDAASRHGPNHRTATLKLPPALVAAVLEEVAGGLISGAGGLH